MFGPTQQVSLPKIDRLDQCVSARKTCHSFWCTVRYSSDMSGTVKRTVHYSTDVSRTVRHTVRYSNDVNKR